MRSLNLKKTGVSLLMLAIVAGCTTNSPVKVVEEAPKSKVDTVKVSSVLDFDLGAKTGNSVRVNLKLGGDKKTFAIKNDFPTNTSIQPLQGGFSVEIHLFRTPTNATYTVWPSPRQRYDYPAPVNMNDSTQSGTIFRHAIKDPAIDNPIVFHNLQAGFYYLLSARVYSPPLNIAAENIIFDTDGSSGTNNATNIINARTPMMPGDPPGLDLGPTLGASYAGFKYFDLNKIVINRNDIILSSGNFTARAVGHPFGPSNSSVSIEGGGSADITAATPAGEALGFIFSTPGSTPLIGATFNTMYRNVVGTDEGQNYNTNNGYVAGDGMAYFTTAAGGGTAGAYTTQYGYYLFASGCCSSWYTSYNALHQYEETVTVDGSNPPVINNDDTLSNRTANNDILIPNNSWDMEIYLMNSLNSNDVPGNIQIIPGATAGGTGESVTTP
jgi:hypothetical protein